MKCYSNISPNKSTENLDTQSNPKIWETLKYVKDKITVLLVRHKPVSKNLLHRQRALKADESQFEEVKR
jgi:ABC-type lipoprotein export system ATPase subunit